MHSTLMILHGCLHRSPSSVHAPLWKYTRSGVEFDRLLVSEVHYSEKDEKQKNVTKRKESFLILGKLTQFFNVFTINAVGSKINCQNTISFERFAAVATNLWRCAECAVHHERDVMCTENNTHIYVARTSNNIVISLHYNRFIMNET